MMVETKISNGMMIGQLASTASVSIFRVFILYDPWIYFDSTYNERIKIYCDIVAFRD